MQSFYIEITNILKLGIKLQNASEKMSFYSMHTAQFIRTRVGRKCWKFQLSFCLPVADQICNENLFWEVFRNSQVALVE